MDIINRIEDPDARMVARALAGLISGLELPAFDTDAWRELHRATEAVSRQPVGKAHFELGLTALAVLLVHMTVAVQLETALTTMRSEPEEGKPL